MAFPTTAYTNEVTAAAALRNELINLGLTAEGLSDQAMVISFIANALKDLRSINPIGYQTGKAAGGAVTQATSISTGVTLSKITGAITTVSSTLAAAGEADFVVTNTLVAANDAVVVWVKTYTGAGTPLVAVSTVAAGSFTVRITNLHAANAFDGALVIGFLVLKGAID